MRIVNDSRRIIGKVIHAIGGGYHGSHRVFRPAEKSVFSMLKGRRKPVSPGKYIWAYPG
ncbi:hypothetical protein [Paraburkholderia sp.]|uniref:hypothetical protein n=1 Tax=Paraburkholderia sp. TaxID=1926495 RepID=UPI0023845B3C|nr:hypothetical protein [Paraburkholderia sp.]MDE1181160.1 hypothetical protein [Paraburkholderia sp.]